MGALLALIGRLVGFAAAGYVANDIVEVVQERKQAETKEPFDAQQTLGIVLTRWQSTQFYIKLGLVVLFGLLISILFMSRIQRKKLLK